MTVEWPRSAYEACAPAMLYVETRDAHGNVGIGSAFHIGDGTFVTARHVVADREICSVGTVVPWNEPDPNGRTTIHGRPGRFNRWLPSEGSLVGGPMMHPDPDVDVAALAVAGVAAPAVPLGSHLDDWLGNELVLSEAVVFGFPPIPLSKRADLVCATGEVNAIVDRYNGERHPYFVLSSMARGGFSGGLAWSRYGFALGVVAQAAVQDGKTAELGFLSVLNVEPIYVCLGHHGVLPQFQAEGFADGLFGPRDSPDDGEPF